ncbi:hypothetical protein GF362_02885 [Candidatus Dojkabacteria bacterium]|nr:hypothetical protein [Candidatus Dojkabacteria bacterium]
MIKPFKFIKTSTAGNRTGFILSVDNIIQRKNIVESIIKNKNIEAEQYAFLSKKENYCVMDTFGDELCGGALLASTVIMNNFSGSTSILSVNQSFKADIITRNKIQKFVKLSLPLKTIKNKPRFKFCNQLGVSGYSVHLDGIAYFVTKEAIIKNININLLNKIDKELNTNSFPCLGIIQIIDSNKLKPLIWVKSIDTITYEEGCTTGTIATQLSFPTKDGIWFQPSGQFIKAQINDNIYTEAGVEILSEGKIYLSNNE